MKYIFHYLYKKIKGAWPVMFRLESMTQSENQGGCQ